MEVLVILLKLSLIFAQNNFLLKTKLFLITPPFTQLNTPYPATAYIKGFLNTIDVESVQADLGIEVILKLFKRIVFVIYLFKLKCPLNSFPLARVTTNQ